MQWTTLSAIAPGPAAANDRAPALLKKVSAVADPDGHRFVLVNHGASVGRPA
jgi:hypothetical protein